MFFLCLQEFSQVFFFLSFHQHFKGLHPRLIGESRLVSTSQSSQLPSWTGKLSRLYPTSITMPSEQNEEVIEDGLPLRFKTANCMVNLVLKALFRYRMIGSVVPYQRNDAQIRC